MLGTRTIIPSLLLCSALTAQTVWFPLDEGNVWVYRATGAIGASGYTVRVDRSATFGSHTYYSLVTDTMIAGAVLVATPPSAAAVAPGAAADTLWLRNADDGRIMRWDGSTSSERVYLDTAAKPGETSESSVDPCNPTSTVVSREARYSGPVGEFTNALQIKYGFGGCADAGLDTDILLPYVGLLSRTAQTIAGPRRYDLTYARLGTATIISAPELSFGLSIDNHAPVANLMPPVDPKSAIPVIQARISLRNTTESPLTLHLDTSQDFEMVLWNSEGKQIWRWSDGMAFTQATRDVTFHKGERVWTESIRLSTSGSADTGPLPAGRYVLECWITSSLGRTFTASVPLTLAHVY